jgi:hypothetical protein
VFGRTSVAAFLPAPNLRRITTRTRFEVQATTASPLEDFDENSDGVDDDDDDFDDDDDDDYYDKWDEDDDDDDVEAFDEEDILFDTTSMSASDLIKMLEDGEKSPADIASMFGGSAPTSETSEGPLQGSSEDLVCRAWNEARLCMPPTTLLQPPPHASGGWREKNQHQDPKTRVKSVKNANQADAEKVRAVCNAVKTEGVVRVDGVLSLATAAALRTFILEELDREISNSNTAASSSASSSSGQEGDGSAGAAFSSVLSPRDSVSSLVQQTQQTQQTQSPPPTTRWDLRLPMAPPVRAALTELLFNDDAAATSSSSSSSSSSVVGASLEKLAGSIGLDAEVWELAALVSKPGAAPQTIHSDTLWSDEPVLYTCFVSLQDTTSVIIISLPFCSTCSISSSLLSLGYSTSLDLPLPPHLLSSTSSTSPYLYLLIFFFSTPSPPTPLSPHYRPWGRPAFSPVRTPARPTRRSLKATALKLFCPQRLVWTPQCLSVHAPCTTVASCTVAPPTPPPLLLLLPPPLLLRLPARQHHHHHYQLKQVEDQQ